MLFCPWDSPGNTAGVDCHVLLQRIFLTQRSNLHLSYESPALGGQFFTARATWEALLISYTPIQNKKLKEKKKRTIATVYCKKCYVDVAYLSQNILLYTFNAFFFLLKGSLQFPCLKWRKWQQRSSLFVKEVTPILYYIPIPVSIHQ